MAIYRQIHVDFWQDEIVTELSPEEKYFYLYLMTNNRTTQCGVYRFNLKVMAFDLGYDKSTVEKLLTRFVANGRIKYNEDENEIYLVNWLKYNSARSPKVAKVIDKQLADVRTIEFKKDIISRCIQYGYPIDTVSQPEPEPEPSKEPTDINSLAEDILKINKIVTTLQGKGIHAANNPSFLNDFSKIYRIVGHSMTEHLANIIVQADPKNPISYSKKIVSEWQEKSIDTVEKAIADSESRKAKPYADKEDNLDDLRRQFGG